MEKSFTIHDLPKTERPRERLIKLGSESLSIQELLTLIIARGTPNRSAVNIAQELLARFKNLKGISEATIEQLCEIKGIGSAKAAQIKACFEILKRLETQDKEISGDTVISSPKDVAEFAQPILKDKKKEYFLIFPLDSRNRIAKESIISVGTLTANLVHPREVFKEAISRNAVQIIVIHNHPSGDPEPSEDDLEITKRLIESGKILDIEVFDHIIVAKNAFFSFKERRLIRPLDSS
ncbi:JAB domain-containing protein [candidate division NPL-UPA2 bacterium Unc8]|uniref:JAB domain-containing protein n=1 Tax=candidate division NPL-UPA2 bacterium Unc8 TaxID=1980939 RepID=A0A399FZD6_UNCN2|nr:MAG: JAB domain-containing protein [candidate division NPL-UPA2 bacterium Unc8]